jgi:hypothetical protein
MILIGSRDDGYERGTVSLFREYCAGNRMIQITTLLLGLAGIGGCILLSNIGYEAGGIAAIVASFSPMVVAALSNLKKQNPKQK